MAEKIRSLRKCFVSMLVMAVLFGGINFTSAEESSSSSKSGSKANIKIEKEGKTISIKGILPLNITEIQIQINSSRNHAISNYHQVSPLNPGYEQLILEKEPTDWNIFYPIVDVSLTEKMQGVAIFEKSVNSSCYFF